ncbi:hypothetical protein MMC21_007690 [Puttea exsequens]|nr:hypothetical protein [Puttea exsequens]
MSLAMDQVTMPSTIYLHPLKTSQDELPLSFFEKIGQNIFALVEASELPDIKYKSTYNLRLETPSRPYFLKSNEMNFMISYLVEIHECQGFVPVQLAVTDRRGDEWSSSQLKWGPGAARHSVAWTRSNCEKPTSKGWRLYFATARQQQQQRMENLCEELLRRRVLSDDAKVRFRETNAVAEKSERVNPAVDGKKDVVEQRARDNKSNIKEWFNIEEDVDEEGWVKV